MKKDGCIHVKIGKFLFIKRYSYCFVIYTIILLKKTHKYLIYIFKKFNIFYYLLSEKIEKNKKNTLIILL